MPDKAHDEHLEAALAPADFLDELGELALGSRLKRLADRIMADAAAIYRHLGHDMQPRWFTLLALLYRHGQCNVVEAAERLGLSQPAISQFSQQLVQRGLISSTPCAEDSRRRVLALTDNGRARVDAMQPMWQAVTRAAQELSQACDNDFYDSLRQCERALNAASLKSRALAHLTRPAEGLSASSPEDKSE